ncbi:TPA: restriction endonuclease subunit S [Legionella pneumophila]|nr:restriction endonuclease subunit S [Legionella pneumophila]
MVPNEWKMESFGKVVALSRTKHDPKKSMIKYPCIELEHLTQETGQIIGYTDSTRLESTKNKFKAGNVLFGKLRPYLKKYAKPDFDGVCSSEIWVFLPTKTLNEDYLFQFVQTDTFIAEANKSAGSKMPRAEWKVISELLFPLPPLPEQKKIAQILSTWDKAITTTEKLLANSEQQKKALVQQLLTGKKRFSKLSTSFNYTKTRYGTIPADWEHPAIRDICSQISEKNSTKANYPVLSCSKYDGFVDSLKYFKKKVYSDDTSAYRLIPRGCFGFPSNHIEEGSIGLQNSHDFGIVSPIYVVFRANPNRVNNQYLFALLKTEHYRQIFSAATNASVDRRGSLRWDEFSSIHVPLPTIEEQNEIASTLSLVDQEIKMLKQTLDHLKQEKKALMQQLLTGKKRVKVAEINNA